ncbi:MAG: hypothetical protein FJ308_19930 [Planctomycetes bacterium]|nr:hypothetical protein [Planctomycetota bacterium]
MNESSAMKAIGSEKRFRLAFMAFMRSRIPAFAILGLCALFGTEAHAESRQDEKTATLSWTVVVPEDTPANAELYMAGNHDSLGSWQPKSFRLERLSAREFTCQLKLPVGMELEYKFTRGSWGTVEKTKDGVEIANRRIRVARDSKIAIEIKGWAKTAVAKPNTGTGDLRWLDIDSKILNGKRRITVWLPQDYRDHCMKRYATLYFLDGQNVFDASRAAFGVEWKADETVKQLTKEKRIQPSIVVAIDNSPDRWNEYSPVATEINQTSVGGGADRYLKFLCEEVKPLIDREFRTIDTPEQTAIIGSSMGGLFVLYALRTRSDVFGSGVAMSPTLFWGHEHTLKAYRAWGEVAAEPATLLSKDHNRKPVSPSIRLWIDMGTREGEKTESYNSELLKSLRRLGQVLEGPLAGRIKSHVLIEEGGEHNEAAWARRLSDALPFIMPEPLEPLEP